MPEVPSGYLSVEEEPICPHLEEEEGLPAGPAPAAMPYLLKGGVMLNPEGPPSRGPPVRRFELDPPLDIVDVRCTIPASVLDTYCIEGL